jgi:hypothetical protein
MTFSTHITLRQYVKLMFLLAYRKPVLILLVIFDVLMMLWVITFYTGLLRLPEPEYPQYMAIVLISVVQPVVIYITIRKNYLSSTRLSGKVELTITQEKVSMRGHMFCSEFSWHKAYKLVETKNWFLIYENTLAAVLIPKQDLTHAQQDQFRNLVRTVPDLERQLSDGEK